MQPKDPSQRSPSPSSRVGPGSGGLVVPWVTVGTCPSRGPVLVAEDGPSSCAPRTLGLNCLPNPTHTPHARTTRVGPGKGSLRTEAQDHLRSTDGSVSERGVSVQEGVRHGRTPVAHAPSTPRRRGEVPTPLTPRSLTGWYPWTDPRSRPPVAHVDLFDDHRRGLVHLDSLQCGTGPGRVVLGPPDVL